MDFSVKVLLGTPKFEDKRGARTPVYWDTSRSINAHAIVSGSSGTGKTHRLRYLINEMARQNPGARFLVIDVHGDIVIPGASRVRFSETTNWGLNPLKINADPEYGGVRKRVRNFIATLQRTSRVLGSKQEATLIALLNDLYVANGFYPDRPESWSVAHDTRPSSSRRYQKRQPNMTDLKRFSEFRLRQMTIGTGSAAVAKLEELNRKFRSLDRANTKGGGQEDSRLARLKQDCKELYAKYIDSIETGREIEDVIKYNSREVMQSVYERIVNMESSGVFKDSSPPFDPSAAVWNYDIATLSTDEQKIFVDVLLEDIFSAAKERGEQPSPDTFVIIDEAHKFVSDDDGHIVNVIAKEARKFGLGLILASQSLSDFPDDIIANSATKIILGIDEMFHDAVSRKLRIKPERLGWIVAQKTALVLVKNAGDMSNRYQEVFLPS